MKSLYDYCMENDSDLLSQWHPTKNGDLTPEQVFPKSHKRVWWCCSHGHEWQAIVKSRTAGTGCPVCARKVIMPGENDLATTHPHLVSQWHPTLNDTLTPSDVFSGSIKRVWWVCELGHEWQAIVSARAGNDDGCPICIGKIVLPGFNDLATHFPHVAAQWHPTLNGHLTPDRVAPKSNRKAWWVCEKGHAYQTIVAIRALHGSNVGCPYCSGQKVLAGFNDLATKHPDIAKQWHPELNGDLTPEMVTSGSHKRIWWKCLGGHSWQARVDSRTGKRATGCPYCAGKKQEVDETEKLGVERRCHHE